MVLLGALDERQDSREGLDGIGIAAHHHVGETNVVVGGDVAGRYSCKHGL